MRILHVFTEMSHGGAEMRTLDIMRHIDRGKFQLEFCALTGKPGDLNGEVRKLGGKIHLCRLGPSFPWRFARLLRDGGFDVVHCHVHAFSGFLLRLAYKCKTPIRIAHFRSTSSGQQTTFRYRLQTKLMRRYIDRHATHILGVGENALSEGWSPTWIDDYRCVIIHNGLDVTPFEAPADPSGVRREFGWPTDCPLLIHVGRMTPAKNHLRLIEIAGCLMRQEPSLRLLLVGKDLCGVKRHIIERLRALGIEDRVVLSGCRDDVPRLLKAANLMLFPSLWEGLPGVVLEACAAGLPVLASHIPGVVEIASQFPAVRCLSLQASNERWVAVARELLECGASNSARDTAYQSFASSMYGIERCANAHELVWSGASGTETRKLYA